MANIRERIANLQVRASNRWFIPEGSLPSVLSHNEIQNVLSQDATLGKHELTKHVNLVAKSATKILAILILMCKERKLVRGFLQDVLDDRRLPLSERQLGDLKDPPFEQQFLLEQYVVLAPVFQRGAIHRRISEEYVLPFLKNEPVVNGEGAFGKVFRIEIHPAHQRLNESTNSGSPVSLFRVL